MADGVVFRPNEKFSLQIHKAAVQAMTEVFTENIVPEAKRLSPVGTLPHDKHPGKNRDSIGVVISDDEAAGTVTATMFTDSGYGFYLEHGTAHRTKQNKRIRAKPGKFSADRTPARPYMWPAYVKFRRKIIARWKELIGAGE